MLVTNPLKAPGEIVSTSTFLDVVKLSIINSFIACLLAGCLYIFIRIFIWKFIIRDDWDLLYDYGFFFIKSIPMHYFVGIIFFVCIQLPITIFSKNAITTSTSFKYIIVFCCTIMFINHITLLVSFFARDNFQSEMKYIRLIPGLIAVYLMCYQLFLGIYCGISLARIQKSNPWLGGLLALIATAAIVFVDRSFVQSAELKFWKKLKHHYSSAQLACLTFRSTRTLPLRGTVLDQRLDFPSLANRAASAAPVSFTR